MFPTAAVFGVDIPIGLPEKGARQCETEARQLLGWPRMTSVFSAPLRACLAAGTYLEACEIRFRIEGKRMSRQAFGILPKIREVDDVLATARSLSARVIEVHPEVSFLLMNGAAPMRHRKKSPDCKAERRALLEAQWPDCIEGMRASLRGQDYVLDDLHDAMAALWSARRWVGGARRRIREGTQLRCSRDHGSRLRQLSVAENPETVDCYGIRAATKAVNRRPTLTRGRRAIFAS
jgi:predicted RNase H-like nuclease